MALTNIQREVCRVLARQRIASGESYVAGGAALNTLLDAPRISQDLDLWQRPAGDKLSAMKVLTYEGVVERGEVKLPKTVRLPERAKVYVVVPGVEDLPPSQIHTPRLLRPEQLSDFAIQVTEGEDAAVR